MVRIFSWILSGILRVCVAVYQLVLSPLIVGASCRYQPTCSVYAQQALRRYGLGRALVLIFKRLGKCHPWSRCVGGYDPLPEECGHTKATHKDKKEKK